MKNSSRNNLMVRYHHAALDLLRTICEEEKLEIYKTRDFKKIRELPMELENKTYYPFLDLSEGKLARLLVPRPLRG